MDQHETHVVLVPYPSQGHINPLLQFAKRLASKNIKSTIATTPYTLNSISAPNVHVEPISDGFDVSGFSQAQNEEIYLKSFKENGSRTLYQFIQKFKNSNSPVVCVVYDSFLPWALDVAKEHGIYGAPFFTNSATVSNIFCRIYYGFLSLPVNVESIPLLIPGLPPLNYNDLPSFLRFPESHPAYLAMKLSQFCNVDKADWVFSNTFEQLEGEALKSIANYWPAMPIGPMVPSAYLDNRIIDDKGYGASLWKPLREECIKWLETKPPKSVVYISFGSMVTLTTIQMEEIAWGLIESNFHFLWVLKESERSKLPEKIMDFTKEKGLTVAWCNQLETLANRAVGCFVTHCGWNSTLEGLSLGVPMVGVPQWADQLTDAKFVEEIWEVGVRGKEEEKGIVWRKELVKCLKQVMCGERREEIMKNANKWRDLAKEAISEGGSSDKCIDKFVEHLTGVCNGKSESNGFINGHG